MGLVLHVLEIVLKTEIKAQAKRGAPSFKRESAPDKHGRYADGIAQRVLWRGKARCDAANVVRLS